MSDLAWTLVIAGVAVGISVVIVSALRRLEGIRLDNPAQTVVRNNYVHPAGCTCWVQAIRGATPADDYWEIQREPDCPLPDDAHPSNAWFVVELSKSDVGSQFTITVNPGMHFWPGSEGISVTRAANPNSMGETPA